MQRFTGLLGLIVILVVASFGSYARDNGQYADVDPVIKRWVEGLTERTAKRDWRKARAFLLAELE